MARARTTPPPVILFGYDSSPFTQKVRLSLRLKQVPYTFVTVPSMPPRATLRDGFHVTYRKIPVLAVGRDVYCDTSVMLDALEAAFPAGDGPDGGGFASLYPRDAAGRATRTLIRGFASFWTDRPLFRVTTGLIPASVWRTRFGRDRSQLIGHALDAAKLEAKVPQNLSALDLHLSLFEAHFADAGAAGGGWVFSTPTPSLADVSLYYQLEWGNDIAKGRGIANLTGGETNDTNSEGASSVFSESRYPRLWEWYQRMTSTIAALPNVETRIEGSDLVATRQAIEMLNGFPKRGAEAMLATPAGQHAELDARTGLMVGQGLKVSVAPDDTGRGDPTIGTLVGLSPEEIVIEPAKLDDKDAVVDVAVHFPRIGFVIKPFKEAKL